jgi:plastocyanin
MTCCALPLQAASLTVKVRTYQNEPLPDAVVFLETAGTTSMPMPAGGHFEIEQKNKMFHPFVSVIPVGARVMFPNRDGIGHHVYSFSPPRKFQLPLSEHESTDTITFDQPGLVTVGCNIHDWMVAYIYIVATPYHAITSAEGLAVVENLPDGEYELHLTHPGIKSGTDMIRHINTATETSLEFTLEIKPEYLWRPAPQDDEDSY